MAKAYGGARAIDWLEVMAGEKAFNDTGEWLPEATLDAIRDYRVAIKGPLTTPVGGGIRSVNVQLRQVLDLYACVRPVRYIAGIPSPMKAPENVDMVVFRENTEDVYIGYEWEADSPMAKKLIDFIDREEGRRIRAGSAARDAGSTTQPRADENQTTSRVSAPEKRRATRSATSIPSGASSFCMSMSIFPLLTN